MRRRRRNLSQERVQRARRLRREMSVSEKFLATWLGRLGFKFRRQHLMGDYTLDFYCAEARLNIEVDGEQHLLSKAYDARRDAGMQAQGVLVLRIPSLDLFDSEEDRFTPWIKEIRKVCEERTGRESFEPW